jgi:hypothetical protein
MSKTLLFKISDICMKIIAVSFFLGGLFCMGIAGWVIHELFTHYTFVAAHWEGALGIFSTAAVVAILLIGFSSEMYSDIKCENQVCSCKKEH